MKILLVMPGRGQIQYKKSRFRPLLPPSSLLEVAGIAREVSGKDEVRIWDELVLGPVDEKTISWAELVGISGLSPSHFGAYRVAKLARDLGKGIVAGGMHVTGSYSEGRGEELLFHYDALVVGRLTKALWAQLLDDFSRGKMENRVYQAGPDDPWEFVLPNLDPIVPHRYGFPAVIRSSAGCPMNCGFCTVGLVTGNCVRPKPTDLLEQELENLPQTRRPVIDYSDSFGANHSHAVNEVLPLYRRSGRRWLTEITIKNLMGIGGRQPLLGPMVDAGCMGVYVGVESIHQRVGAKSPERELVEETIREARKAKLIVMVSLMLDVTGEETEESIKETVEWVIDQRLDFVQYSLTAALPGSLLRREALAKDNLISHNPEHYDGAWPTLRHRLSPKQRIDLLKHAYYRTYSLAGVMRRIWGHHHLHFSLAANALAGLMARRWWKKVGFEHWSATREFASA